ncbi:MAG: PDZ domain-containing protein [Gammaproteobacteria bacterium]|nr:PDZ domain-containing protein [Gammaproteobacteria bacterium]MBV8405281.1 PDZ domain-containing protein [Gammaproteobacteria bacterium]
MLRELRCASLCLLCLSLSWARLVSAGDAAPASPASVAPVSPPPAVPQPPAPAPEPGPAPPRSSPPLGPPGSPEGSAAVAAEQAAAIEENPDWAVTLQRIAGSVVSIDVDQTRAFDTEWNNSAQATGFVVDAEHGLILTNRHVVTPGPVTAEATFLNREEVQLYPVYRDPVHDFGFYRYDPQKLRFIKPRALALYPEGAQIGREIRVVGNNAGEQLSILAGTLARLDRDAPEYGVTKYNDFNTFYLQAASGTSGGSSGSPVIDIRGRVVALNAGGANGAASSFYLPLGRVRRALTLIQQGKPVSRGTLYTVFNYMPYDELERLGLDAGTEAAVRKDFPRYTGMLVVTEVLPGSPSEKVLQPGDILLRLNGRYLAQFEPLEEVLDSSVGSEVELELERGGKLVSTKLPVGDLHAITPSAYAEFGDAVVNTLSYQQARHFNVPARGIYVANPGYVLGAATIPRGAVILNLNGSRTDTLQQFESGIAQLGDGDRATVRYLTIDDPNNTDLRVVRMDRLWFPAHHCDRDDERGLWDCHDLPSGPAPKTVPPSSTAFPHFSDPRMNALAPSLAMVTFDMPYSVSGITERNYHGTGLVVDAQRGLVVVDRNTVPVSVGDVTVTFAGTVQVPGRVVYIHPLHNYAVVAYDPRLIGTTPVRAAKLTPRELTAGESLWAVGLGGDSQMRSRSTQIAGIEPLDLPLSRTMRFRDSNIETIQLVNPPNEFDGVLADKDGGVVGTWSSFAYENGREIAQDTRGVPIELLADMIDRVRTNRPLHSLDAELGVVPLASARQIGLSDAWIQRLAQRAPTRRQALTVVRLVGGSDAAERLQQGDLLLAIDEQVVTRFREVERAAADKDHVKVTVWRGKAEQTIDVATTELPGTDVGRLVEWAGATLQAPHRAMSVQRGIDPVGVYVAYFAYGSPATRYGLYPGRRIMEVDGVATPDLDTFLKLVTGRPDRSSVRLKTITWNNAPEVITLKLDKHYWPAYELTRSTDGSWARRTLE